MPPRHGTPAILSESGVPGLHFAADIVVECITAVQGHPRSLILVAVEWAYESSN